MSENWKPIETAPRDGTHVMLGYKAKSSRSKSYPYHKAWSAPGWFDKENGNWWNTGEHHTDYHAEPIYPSHWQPYPEPPQ